MNWRERFGLSDASLAHWQSKLPPGESLLRWCLVTGQIPEADYLEWASRKYQLPVVTSEFFSIPADQIFWEQVKGMPTWSPSLVPLAQWQGVLQIACLEPPIGVRISGAHCFVLASPTSLEVLWASLHPGYQALVQPSDGLGQGQELDARGTVTESINLDLPDGFAGLKDLSLAVAEPSLENEASPPQEENDTLELPDGMALAAMTSNLDFSSLLGSNKGAAPVVPTHAPEPEVSLPPLVENEESVTAALNLEAISPSPASASAPAPTHGLDTSSDDHIPSEDELMAFQKDRTQISRVFDLSQLSAIPEAKITVEPSSIHDVTPVPLNQCSSYDEIAAQTLLTLKATFEHGMILLFQGGQLRPWKWTSSLKPRSQGQPSPIDLSAPSIFRIAYRTCLPYHGYIVGNPVNDLFFAEWQHGQQPRHVTLVPLIVNGQLAGMVLGMTNQPIAQKAVLKLMEQLAQDVSSNFRRLRDSLAA